MNKLFQLSFLPRSADLALLVLRLWIGLSMLILHGWSKLMNFSTARTKMLDPLHIGSTASLTLVVLAEVVCAALIVIGWGTRLAALILAIEMGVVFFMVHHAKLAMGAGSGELAFLYLGGAIVLFIAGSGKYAVDEG